MSRSELAEWVVQDLGFRGEGVSPGGDAGEEAKVGVGLGTQGKPSTELRPRKFTLPSGFTSRIATALFATLPSLSEIQLLAPPTASMPCIGFCVPLQSGSCYATSPHHGHLMASLRDAMPCTVDDLGGCPGPVLGDPVGDSSRCRGSGSQFQ